MHWRYQHLAKHSIDSELIPKNLKVQKLTIRNNSAQPAAGPSQNTKSAFHIRIYNSCTRANALKSSMQSFWAGVSFKTFHG
jgi:hypothetical protein